LQQVHPRERSDTGIVYQQVYLAQAGDGLIEESLVGRGIGDVAYEGQKAPPECLYLVGQGVQGAGVGWGCHACDVVASVRKRERYGAANTPAGTGHQCDWHVLASLWLMFLDAIAAFYLALQGTGQHRLYWRGILTDGSHAVIRCESLSKTFYLTGGGRVEAVRDISIEARPGEVLGILGPNGAGKTTFLRMLGTIITPSSGRVWIDGQDARESPNLIRRQLGYLSGNTKLYGRLTPAEIFRYFGQLYGMSAGDIAVRTRELTALLGLEEFLNRRCDTLSTGQTQRVSIARVILHRPSVLILDEPTLGLDIMSSRGILDFISRSRAEGHCILYSTHYMTEAERLCDRIALMHRGTILAEGNQESLRARTGADDLQGAFLALAGAETATA